MRIHGQQPTLQAAEMAGAANYRAENAERSGRTRRRLMKAAQTLDAAALESADPGAGLLVDQWLSVRHNAAMAEDEYTPGSIGGAAKF